MARFERRSSRDAPRRGSRGGPVKRGSRNAKGGPRRGPGRPKRDGRRGPGRPRRDEGRYSDRPKRTGKNRRDLEMTKVTCDSCGARCEVPFKPTSDKPIYCDDCFRKDSLDRSSRGSSAPNKDLAIINKKLDKIMVALDIK
ncbi:MAG: CxxC-x17-CxxC domain-containing protein [Candidatus Nanoarchaeia archaeon]